jgi:hypothetical protein
MKLEVGVLYMHPPSVSVHVVLTLNPLIKLYLQSTTSKMADKLLNVQKRRGHFLVIGIQQYNNRKCSESLPS